MAYQAQDFSHLLGTQGFSDNLLNTHFGLYQGYVANTNKLLEKFDALRGAEETGPECAEMRRRFGWEFDGMRLHEYYFGNMTKEKKAFDASSALAAKLKEQFGSTDAWQKDFVATGAMRGIGWAVLSYDCMGDRLLNTWINEHDAGHLAGTRPLLIMDVFEHAFMLDYGTKRADYIESFMNAVDWEEVNKRFDAAA